MSNLKFARGLHQGGSHSRLVNLVLEIDGVRSIRLWMKTNGVNTVTLWVIIFFLRPLRKSLNSGRRTLSLLNFHPKNLWWLYVKVYTSKFTAHSETLTGFYFARVTRLRPILGTVISEFPLENRAIQMVIIVRPSPQTWFSSLLALCLYRRMCLGWLRYVRLCRLHIWFWRYNSFIQNCSYSDRMETRLTHVSVISRLILS